MRLASYLTYPKGVVFETQAKEERIVLLLRQHPLTQLSWILFALLLTFVPLIGVPVLLEILTLPEFVTLGLIVYVIFFWYLGVFGYAFMRFLLWLFNVNIVTNERLVDIDFPYLLYKESTATRIEQIEDLTYRRGGFARTSFNFGDVLVQTAGAQPNIEFIDIPNPGDVVREIVSVWQEKEPDRAGAFLAEHDEL